MYTSENYKTVKQKTFLKYALGCFFGLIILRLVGIGVFVWAISFMSKADEKQLVISHSPNDINTIEVIAKNEFPHQISTIIQYGDKSIIKMYRPDNVAIEWHNDYEADVIFTIYSKEPETFFVKFD